MLPPCVPPCPCMGMVVPLRACADAGGTRGSAQLQEQCLRHHPRRCRQFVLLVYYLVLSWGLRSYGELLMPWTPVRLLRVSLGYLRVNLGVEENGRMRSEWGRSGKILTPLHHVDGLTTRPLSRGDIPSASSLHHFRQKESSVPLERRNAVMQNTPSR